MKKAQVCEICGTNPADPCYTARVNKRLIVQCEDCWVDDAAMIPHGRRHHVAKRGQYTPDEAEIAREVRARR
jgi:hypothetical protein